MVIQEQLDNINKDVKSLQTAFNLNGAVLSLFVLAIFSIAHDDLERDWDIISSSGRRNYIALSIFSFFIVLSLGVASISASQWNKSRQSCASVKYSTKNHLTQASDLVELHAAGIKSLC
jgi:hypothetical protein